MSRDIQIGKELYRIQQGNVTVLYDKRKDQFSFGCINVDKFNKDDLIDLNEATTILLNYIGDGE